MQTFNFGQFTGGDLYHQEEYSSHLTNGELANIHIGGNYYTTSGVRMKQVFYKQENDGEKVFILKCSRIKFLGGDTVVVLCENNGLEFFMKGKSIGLSIKETGWVDGVSLSSFYFTDFKKLFIPRSNHRAYGWGGGIVASPERKGILLDGKVHQKDEELITFLLEIEEKEMVKSFESIVRNARQGATSPNPSAGMKLLRYCKEYQKFAMLLLLANRFDRKSSLYNLSKDVLLYEIIFSHFTEYEIFRIYRPQCFIFEKMKEVDKNRLLVSGSKILSEHFQNILLKRSLLTSSTYLKNASISIYNQSDRNRQTDSLESYMKKVRNIVISIYLLSSQITESDLKDANRYFSHEESGILVSDRMNKAFRKIITSNLLTSFSLMKERLFKHYPHHILYRHPFGVLSHKRETSASNTINTTSNVRYSFSLSEDTNVGDNQLETYSFQNPYSTQWNENQQNNEEEKSKEDKNSLFKFEDDLKKQFISFWCEDWDSFTCDNETLLHLYSKNLCENTIGVVLLHVKDLFGESPYNESAKDFSKHHVKLVKKFMSFNTKSRKSEGFRIDSTFKVFEDMTIQELYKTRHEFERILTLLFPPLYDEFEKVKNGETGETENKEFVKFVHTNSKIGDSFCVSIHRLITACQFEKISGISKLPQTEMISFIRIFIKYFGLDKFLSNTSVELQGKLYTVLNREPEETLVSLSRDPEVLEYYSSHLISIFKDDLWYDEKRSATTRRYMFSLDCNDIDFELIPLTLQIVKESNKPETEETDDVSHQNILHHGSYDFIKTRKFFRYFVSICDLYATGLRKKTIGKESSVTFSEIHKFVRKGWEDHFYGSHNNIQSTGEEYNVFEVFENMKNQQQQQQQEEEEEEKEEDADVDDEKRKLLENEQKLANVILKKCKVGEVEYFKIGKTLTLLLIEMFNRKKIHHEEFMKKIFSQDFQFSNDINTNIPSGWNEGPGMSGSFEENSSFDSTGFSMGYNPVNVFLKNRLETIGRHDSKNPESLKRNRNSISRYRFSAVSLFLKTRLEDIERLTSSELYYQKDHEFRRSCLDVNEICVIFLRLIDWGLNVFHFSVEDFLVMNGKLIVLLINSFLNPRICISNSENFRKCFLEILSLVSSLLFEYSIEEKKELKNIMMKTNVLKYFLNCISNVLRNFENIQKTREVLYHEEKEEVEGEEEEQEEVIKKKLFSDSLSEQLEATEMIISHIHRCKKSCRNIEDSDQMDRLFSFLSLKDHHIAITFNSKWMMMKKSTTSSTEMNYPLEMTEFRFPNLRGERITSFSADPFLSDVYDLTPIYLVDHTQQTLLHNVVELYREYYVRLSSFVQREVKPSSIGNYNVKFYCLIIELISNGVYHTELIEFLYSQHFDQSFSELLHFNSLFFQKADRMSSFFDENNENNNNNNMLVKAKKEKDENFDFCVDFDFGSIKKENEGGKKKLEKKKKKKEKGEEEEEEKEKEREYLCEVHHSIMQNILLVLERTMLEGKFNIFNTRYPVERITRMMIKCFKILSDCVRVSMRLYDNNLKNKKELDVKKGSAKVDEFYQVFVHSVERGEKFVETLLEFNTNRRRRRIKEEILSRFAKPKKMEVHGKPQQQQPEQSQQKKYHPQYIPSLFEENGFSQVPENLQKIIEEEGMKLDAVKNTANTTYQPISVMMSNQRKREMCSGWGVKSKIETNERLLIRLVCDLVFQFACFQLERRNRSCEEDEKPNISDDVPFTINPTILFNAFLPKSMRMSSVLDQIWNKTENKGQIISSSELRISNDNNNETNELFFDNESLEKLILSLFENSSDSSSFDEGMYEYIPKSLFGIIRLFFVFSEKPEEIVDFLKFSGILISNCSLYGSEEMDPYLLITLSHLFLPAQDIRNRDLNSVFELTSELEKYNIKNENNNNNIKLPFFKEHEMNSKLLYLVFRRFFIQFQRIKFERRKIRRRGFRLNIDENSSDDDDDDDKSSKNTKGRGLVRIYDERARDQKKVEKNASGSGVEEMETNRKKKIKQCTIQFLMDVMEEILKMDNLKNYITMVHGIHKKVDLDLIHCSDVTVKVVNRFLTTFVDRINKSEEECGRGGKMLFHNEKMIREIEERISKESNNNNNVVWKTAENQKKEIDADNNDESRPKSNQDSSLTTNGTTNNMESSYGNNNCWNVQDDQWKFDYDWK